MPNHRQPPQNAPKRNKTEQNKGKMEQNGGKMNQSPNQNNPQNTQNRPKWNQTEPNGTEVKKSPLSRRQEHALPAIAAAATNAQAARNSGIGKTTLHRWLQDEIFRQELTRERQETAALARQELQGLMLRSIAVISDALDAPEMSVRLRAARYTLSLGHQIHESEKLRSDIQEIQELLAFPPQPDPVQDDPFESPYDTI